MPRTDDLKETPKERITVDPPAIDWLRLLPTLGEAELIKHAIQFANGSDDSLLFLRRAIGWPLPASDEAEWVIGLPDTERLTFREALAAIVRSEIPAQRVELWERRAAGILLLPTIQMREGKRAITFRFQPIEIFETPPDPQLAYLLLLFLDSEKPYGRELCQCRLERCGKFFFPDRTQANRPRTKFCSEEHYSEAHAAAGPERVRRSRERRKRAARHK